ncbi:MAG: methyl-accepting chemotaxis protein [Rhodospirillaceae bacterium]|nr:MAG: methyl-accepting chemotaxis protein [Rhodospirillaceae bacterium]
MQNATREAVTAIQGIGGTITEINEVSFLIASAVEEQGAATKEIARNIEQATIGTTEVSKNIGSVTSTAEEAGASASLGPDRRRRTVPLGGNPAQEGPTALSPASAPYNRMGRKTT